MPAASSARLVPAPPSLIVDGHIQPVAHVPTPLTPLLGRESEVEAVRRQIRDPAVRLVTLTGPGGVGKTRLAVAVTSGIAGDFAAGICFVPLGSIRDPALVALTVAHHVGVREMGDQHPVDGLKAALAATDRLLVLDNFEHLLDAAPQIADLLAACPGLTVLATSRERLRLAGEREFPVPPLALPDRTHQHSTAALAGVAAVHLFVERAIAVAPEFALTDDNAPAVAEICRRLDGLPLAIELAAARVKILSPAALLARLERRLPLLIGGARDAPARQRTLRDAIAWSYDLLSPDERTLFRRLAVFTGGVTLEVAEEVAGGGAGEAMGDGANAPAPSHSDAPECRLPILDLIASLVDQSLLRRDDPPGDGGAAEPRFAMLETIREYGLERLDASGETGTVRQQHAACFLALAERAEPELVGSAQGVWLNRLEADLDNLRAALTWYVSRGEAEPALRLAGAVAWFWYGRCHLAEGLHWLESALALDAPVPPVVRARAFCGAALLAQARDDDWAATDFGRHALQLAERAGAANEVPRAWFMLGAAAGVRREWTEAATWYEAALTAFRGQGTRPWAALCLQRLGSVARQQGDLGRAEALLTEALALCRELGFSWAAAETRYFAGEVARDRGDQRSAEAAFREALDGYMTERDGWGIASCLAGLALTAAARGQIERMAKLGGASAAAFEAIGSRSPVVGERAYARTVRLGQKVLGETGFEAAWAAGRALPPAEAIAEVEASGAVDSAGAVGLLPSAQDTPVRLTRREVEVLRLIAAGRSNQQIADALFISPRTASTHAAHILHKLGLSSRAEAVAFAHRHGLA